MRSGRVLVLLLAVIAVAAAVLMLRPDEPILGLEPDQFARLTFLGTWGAVLATGVLVAARGRWRGALASLLFWAAAIGAVVGLYASGPELKLAGQRILAVLDPGRSVDLGDGRFMIARSEDAHFALQATVNGRPLRFLVDTGASVVALDRTSAESLGIRTDTLRYSLRVQTASGLAQAAPITLDTIQVGDIERRNVRAVVIEGNGLGSNLLGLSFLDTLSSYDFRGDRLVLTD